MNKMFLFCVNRFALSLLLIFVIKGILSNNYDTTDIFIKWSIIILSATFSYTFNIPEPPKTDLNK